MGIFSKEPRSGQVKTRLTPHLLPTEASALYRVALTETIERFSAGPAAPVLCITGRRAWFLRTFPGVALLPQGRGDLGARLARTTAALFAAGGSPVAVVGSDSPDLPLALIEEAFAALATADVATIPCMDGGFALLALRRPTPALFTDIPWSTPKVLAATQARAAELGLCFATVGGWDDLDDIAAMHRLMARSPECATARYARVHLGSCL
ncbi:MAG: TIGR04282 family arsenosugar biosynthesis glycosyltransferase [Desulfuromonadales bacterium]|nr:TIGR04282 family arsenosugar biosynthesis glycosyltransferase [Desulfuromonadales bacterium]